MKALLFLLPLGLALVPLVPLAGAQPTFATAETRVAELSWTHVPETLPGVFRGELEVVQRVPAGIPVPGTVSETILEGALAGSSAAVVLDPATFTTTWYDPLPQREVVTRITVTLALSWAETGQGRLTIVPSTEPRGPSVYGWSDHPSEFLVPLPEPPIPEGWTGGPGTLDPEGQNATQGQRPTTLTFLTIVEGRARDGPGSAAEEEPSTSTPLVVGTVSAGLALLVLRRRGVF